MTPGGTTFIERRSARLARGEAGLIRDSIPAGLANQLAAVIHEMWEVDGSHSQNFFRVVWGSLALDPSLLDASWSNRRNLIQRLLTSQHSVGEFLEIVELLVKAANAQWPVGYIILKVGCDEAFTLSRFAYRFAGDDIVEAGTDIENQAVDEARDALLRDPRFADAEEKFVSALTKSTSARGADYPEAVHAAASAVEEVCRELLNDSKILLDHALDTLRTKHDLDPNVVEALKKLYHLRGGSEGAAHGAASGSESIAKFAIHSAAAGMLYLIAECA